MLLFKHADQVDTTLAEIWQLLPLKCCEAHDVKQPLNTVSEISNIAR